jgi:hypothetical protein
MEYTREQRRELFKALPPELQEAILSVDNAEKLDTIREKYGLMLDQAGDLGDELNLLMLGITKQKDFVHRLSERLEIPLEKATSISVDINVQILNEVRISLQKIQEKQYEEPTIVKTPKPAIAPVEKAGNFTVHRPTPSSSPQYKDTGLNREEVLRDLEGINNLKPGNAENYVEHLLTTPVITPAPAPKPVPPQAPAPAAPPTPPVTPVQPPKPAPASAPKQETPSNNIDPYREPV